MPGKVAETDYAAALRNLTNPTFIKSDRYQEQQWRANRDGAHPKILEFSDAFCTRLARLGVPVFPHCIVRTPEEQDSAYVLGHSRIRGSQPYPHRAFAVDIIHSLRAWDLSMKEWEIFGHIGFEIAKARGIALVWGGDWDADGDLHDSKLFDPAHWELAFWRSTQPYPPFMATGGRKPSG